MAGLTQQLDFAPTNGIYNLTNLRTHFMKGGCLSQPSLRTLIKTTTTLFTKETNLLEISRPSVVFGDLHGQYFDLLSQLDDLAKFTETHNLIFLGDYVDRGTFSCEVMITLLCLKANYPKRVFLLRGNHESRQMTESYGFKAECAWKYSDSIYDLFISLFQALPIAAKLHTNFGDFFLCHGGLSPSMKYVGDINGVNRFVEPVQNTLLFDLLWADPISDEKTSQDGWNLIEYERNTERRCSVYFGYKAVDSFFNENCIELLIRAHQCVKNGIKGLYFGDYGLASPLGYTVFSATNYNCNQGAALIIEETGLKVRRYSESTLKYMYDPVLINGVLLGTLVIIKNCENLLLDIIESTLIYGEDEELNQKRTQVVKHDDEMLLVDTSKVHKKEEKEENNGWGDLESEEKERNILKMRKLRKTKKNSNKAKVIKVEKSPEKVEHDEEDGFTVSFVGDKGENEKTREESTKALKKRISSSCKDTRDVLLNIEESGTLSNSVATENPTQQVDLKRIREEIRPLSLAELREEWKAMNKKSQKKI
ncbi:serine/threonine protein phosphatase 2B catalytic subunit, putative [Entamoeba invadens IP1]|uniref:Serine/threonine-protein phosphatase n=1 Tax=Entamoeba invadens IP1 TaxID=370355 RepID=A0A0A1U9L9_ENTIV|nr:serine/threonine protein phosphatase 2B catalytic subunit, putative [Entamoeba invadens IP1]ELP91614.1 serine/threonine protein phosphatase 2B catalytic subunit, putative [Entamoeba invadens IP1]|eukprot:XP_004258385.1 serine/threonine protein phosphatase 2B catalytic subunit, putative [Entamoeba invadens IP1]